MGSIRPLVILLAGLLFVGCCGPLSPSETTYYRGPTSIVSTYPVLDSQISGCNTNIGVSGETTTIYVTISNTGTGKAENVVVRYSANDMDGSPVTQSVGTIPADKKITVSGSIDTRFGVGTTAEVKVQAKDTETITRYSANCRGMDQQTLDNLNYLIQSGLLPV